MLSDSRTAPVETSSSAPATDKIQIQLPPHAGGTSPLGNKVNGTGSSCAQASAIDSSAQLTKSTGTATSNACGSKAGQQNSRSINASSVIVAIIVSLIWALICGSLLNCVLTGVLGLDTLTKIFGSHTDVFYELIYVITFVISYLIICGSWKRDAG